MIKKIKYFLKKSKFITGLYDSFLYYERKKAINNIGYSKLEEVFDNLKEAKLNSFLSYGTLLGFCREGGFIPHDSDIDIGILCNDNFSWKILEDALNKCGLKWIKEYSYNGNVTEKTYGKGFLSIDFFLYYLNDNDMQSYVYYKDDSITYLNPEHYSIRISRAPLLNNIEYRVIHGIKVPIPSNYEDYLEYVYGKNWKVPDPKFKPNIEKIPNAIGIRKR